MRFCDKKLQNHLLNGGKIKRRLGVCEIVLHINNLGYIYDDDCYYTFSDTDLTTDDWTIIEPDYNWSKIIKDKVLCVFSDYEDFKTFNISTLIKINLNNNTYKTNDNIEYSHCKLFNPNDFNIAKNLKEYEN